jgi:hypothetical protein
MSATTGGTVLFSDEFSQDGEVNPALWSYVQYVPLPAPNPAYFGRTAVIQGLPPVIPGVGADLQL